MKIVIHATGTSEEGHIWIEEWQEATSLELPLKCPCCGNKPQDDNCFVGAHVKLLNDITIPITNSRLFITPTCKKCNDTHKETKAAQHPFMVNDNYLWEVTNE